MDEIADRLKLGGAPMPEVIHLAHARYLVGAITHASSIEPANVNKRGCKGFAL